MSTFAQVCGGGRDTEEVNQSLPYLAELLSTIGIGSMLHFDDGDTQHPADPFLGRKTRHPRVWLPMQQGINDRHASLRASASHLMS